LLLWLVMLGAIGATAGPSFAAAGTVPFDAQQIGLGVYRPEFPDDLTVLNKLEQASGKHLPFISWYALWGGWKSAFSRADLDAVAKHGSAPFITWEPWAGAGGDPAWSLQRAILSGANDAYITSWAKGMAAFGQPVYLRFAHEMHNQTYPWALDVNGNTAAEYVAAWRHVHDIFLSNGAGNVRWVWNPNTIGAARASTYLPIYSSLYPGDDAVDLVGLDVYNTGPNLDWGAPYWRAFSDALEEPYRALTQVSNKPVFLAEVASAETGGSKAAWIADALEQQLPASFPRVRALIWFDVLKEENWPLSSSTSAWNAWAAAAQSATYAPLASALNI